MLRRPVEGMRFRGLLGSGRGIRGVGLRAQDLRLGGLSMPFFWGGGGGAWALSVDGMASQASVIFGSVGAGRILSDRGVTIRWVSAALTPPPPPGVGAKGPQAAPKPILSQKPPSMA